MKDKKKLYFFNDRFKDYPKWLVGLVTVVITVGVLEIFFRWSVDNVWIKYGMAFLYLCALIYLIFQNTRKNAFFWMRSHEFKLKIGGKTLEVDAKFLSNFYVQEEVLYIERINRLDSFPIHHLREKDIKKMINLMEIQRKHANEK